MLRLTGTERGVAEVAAIAEHVSSLVAAAAALRLTPDVPREDSGRVRPSLVPLLDEADAPDAAVTLGAIRAWSRDVLGLDHVPAIWRGLAHQPRLLDATWRKDRVVMDAGALDAGTRGCAALAVAQFWQSDYWIGYYTHLLRSQAGFDDRTIVEVAGAVMHYVSFNTIAHGLRLEAPVAGLAAADVAPGGHLEHLLPPGVRRHRT